MIVKTTTCGMTPYRTEPTLWTLARGTHRRAGQCRAQYGSVSERSGAMHEGHAGLHAVIFSESINDPAAGRGCDLMLEQC
jgi:hypothetical protein